MSSHSHQIRCQFANDVSRKMFVKYIYRNKSIGIYKYIYTHMYSFGKKHYLSIVKQKPLKLRKSKNFRDL